ncbi:MAG: hypothetical protein ACLTDV_05615 [Eubacterium sp.]
MASEHRGSSRECCTVSDRRTEDRRTDDQCPADRRVAICEQMADGQIAAYKADSTAAQEDGTVDFVFHVAMTSKMYYHVGGASLCHI